MIYLFWFLVVALVSTNAQAQPVEPAHRIIFDERIEDPSPYTFHGGRWKPDGSAFALWSDSAFVVVDAASGETAARILGRNWDKVDRRAYALMQANNVQVTKADAKFVSDVKVKTSALEAKWVKDAEAKGLKDAAKVLAEFRAEIAKASK